MTEQLRALVRKLPRYFLVGDRMAECEIFNDDGAGYVKLSDVEALLSATGGEQTEQKPPRQWGPDECPGCDIPLSQHPPGPSCPPKTGIKWVGGRE